MLRNVILALLADGKPAHGYALMKSYEERSGARLSIGNVYRELERLINEGMIVPGENPAGSDPRRLPYLINEIGRAALLEWLTSPARSFLKIIPDTLSYRLAILGDIDVQIAISFLEDLQGELWAEGKSLERERAIAAQQEKRSTRTLPTRSLLLSRQARHLAADIELIEEMRSRLQARLGQAVAENPRAATSARKTGRRPKGNKQR